MLDVLVLLHEIEAAFLDLAVDLVKVILLETPDFGFEVCLACLFLFFELIVHFLKLLGEAEAENGSVVALGFPLCVVELSNIFERHR